MQALGLFKRIFSIRVTTSVAFFPKFLLNNRLVERTGKSNGFDISCPRSRCASPRQIVFYLLNKCHWDTGSPRVRGRPLSMTEEAGEVEEEEEEERDNRGRSSLPTSRTHTLSLFLLVQICSRSIFASQRPCRPRGPPHELPRALGQLSSSN